MTKHWFQQRPLEHWAADSIASIFLALNCEFKRIHYILQADKNAMGFERDKKLEV